ncbi:MAG: SPOR domain-containing protein [Glaciecola sp.]|jgi:DedD protein
MAPAIQNRLVGTIIVVALVVIFLPELLDGKKQTRADIAVNIPTSPLQKTIPALNMTAVEDIKANVTLPEQVELVEAATDDTPKSKTDIETSVPEAKDVTQTSTEASAASALSEQTFIQNIDEEEAVGWVIQLGSFKHEKNVQELVKKVEKAGYRVFSKPVETSVGRLTKVFVGPDLDKAKLEDSLSHLKEVTQLTGRVTPFAVN